jgi:predicted DsbA family dithiol-disulfide isomerase
LEPDAGRQLWNAPDWHYPTTVLLAFEAVHAAKRQSLRASKGLDRALRRAFWSESRCIGHHGVILEIATEVRDLYTALLDETLRLGTARRDVFEDLAVSMTDDLAMIPHLFGPDGMSLANPGIAVHWQGDWAKGFPVIDRDDPSVYDELLIAASRGAGAQSI